VPPVAHAASDHPISGKQQEPAKVLPKVLYKGRARIEQGIGKLKRLKRIALRCEKTA
jgi:hypothetical protein